MPRSSGPVRVLHLTGSPTSAFFCDLSRLYAADCLAAVEDPALYEPLIAYVTPDGRWRFPADLSKAAVAAAPSVPVGEALTRVLAEGIDVMVPQMFCTPGMTHYRALFDVLGIAYVGNPPEAMALSVDKSRARAVVAAAGVPVPVAELLRLGERPTLAPPFVVKPVDTDNSVGVVLVRRDEELPGALVTAFSHSDRVLVERYVELGREVRCGVLARDGELIVLPLEEYDVGPDRPVRTEQDKIRRGADGQLALTAKDGVAAWILDPADPLTERVGAVAVACHEALGCRDYSLFDLRVDPDGRPWFLEAGLYCSFARQSVVAVMAEAAGISAQQLFATAVRDALARTA